MATNTPGTPGNPAGVSVVPVGPSFEEIKRRATIVADAYELADMAAKGVLEDLHEWTEEGCHTFDQLLVFGRHDTLLENMHTLIAICEDRMEQGELVAEGLVTDES